MMQPIIDFGRSQALVKIHQKYWGPAGPQVPVKVKFYFVQVLPQPHLKMGEPARGLMINRKHWLPKDIISYGRFFEINMLSLKIILGSVWTPGG